MLAWGGDIGADVVLLHDEARPTLKRHCRWSGCNIYDYRLAIPPSARPLPRVRHDAIAHAIAQTRRDPGCGRDVSHLKLAHLCIENVIIMSAADAKRQKTDAEKAAFLKVRA